MADRRILCPQCNSDHIRRSRSRNRLERFYKIFNYRVYRCRNCNWRGFIKISAKDGKGAGEKRVFPTWAIAGAVLILAIMAVMFIRYCTKAPETGSIERSGQYRTFPAVPKC